ncbi:MAG TPA: hypothetical protein VN832_03225 [Stellaceae bacterium]|nr:hypothetical protein [Stellaceae bacterium]
MRLRAIPGAAEAISEIDAEAGDLIEVCDAERRPLCFRVLHIHGPDGRLEIVAASAYGVPEAGAAVRMIRAVGVVRVFSRQPIERAREFGKLARRRGAMPAAVPYRDQGALAEAWLEAFVEPAGGHRLGRTGQAQVMGFASDAK